MAAISRDSCQPQILQALLNAGANPNEPVFYPSGAMTPIAFLQIQQGSQSYDQSTDADLCVQALRQAGGMGELPQPTSLKSSQEQQLFNAARSGKTDQVAQLLASGVSANITDKQGNTPLMEAARKGKVDTAKQLLQAGADPDMRNGKGQTALAIAVGNKQPALFKPLLDAGTTDTTTPISAALDSGNVKLVRAFVQAGWDIDQLIDGKTLLMQETEILSFLLLPVLEKPLCLFNV